MKPQNSTIREKKAEKNSVLSGVLSFFRSRPEIAHPDKLRRLLVELVVVRVMVVSLLLGASAWDLIKSVSPAGDKQMIFWPIAATYAISVVNVILLRKTKYLYAWGYGQLVCDVLLSSLVIYVTGSNASIFLYVLVILEAAVVFSRHGALIIAGCSGLAYALLNLLPAAGGQHLSAKPSEILLVYLFLVLIGLIGGYFAKQLEMLTSAVNRHTQDLNNLTEQQRQLFDDISEGIVTTDLEAAITSINQAACAIIGLSKVEAEQYIGRSLPSVLKHYGAADRADLMRHLDEGTSDSEIILTNQQNGAELQLDYSVRPLTDTEGNVTGKLFIFNDVSHVRSIEERLSLHERMTKLLSDTAPNSGLTSENGSAVHMIGESPVMRQVFNLVERVAVSDASVLISGESGTGKELIAKGIHARGPRANKPFVAINCGAIPENLIESELFGHKKGSFTGAVTDNIGLFRQASGGTIFLDEIGELPLQMQTKLLRVLQEKYVRAVGDIRDVEIDVRVLAASNRDLRKEVQAGRFREDLYYRLNVVNIIVPPLRDRKEDIPLLVRHFIGRLTSQDQVLPQISPEAFQALMSYPFPGNIRELENMIERALVLGGSAILVEHLPPEVTIPRQSAHPPSSGQFTSGPYANGKEETQIHLLPIDLEGELARIEQDYLTRALAKTGGMKKQAAELLGLNFRSFRYRLKKYGMGDSGADGSELDEF